jgi:hypothetical protein
VAPLHFIIMLTQTAIEEMTIPERWEAMELIWKSIIESQADIPSPAWHEEILRERTKEIESGKAEWMTLDELRVALRLPSK